MVGSKIFDSILFYLKINSMTNGNASYNIRSRYKEKK
ncbi:hypothetical protein SPH9361_02926 [Sphingobium sp. CECT 9361]|nr:hypothetical protein SPH9361_02926 [Sphingobium sp. CECT 9361]